MKNYEVIWTLPAIEALRDIYEFIKVESVEGAKKVATELVTAGNSLSTLPNRNSVEPLLQDEVVQFTDKVELQTNLLCRNMTR